MSLLDQIMTRGFAVQRCFVPTAELERAIEDYRHFNPFGQQVYTAGLAGPQVMSHFRQRIQPILDEFGSSDDFAPNFISAGVYFAIEKGINLDWHQDHDSYYVNQTHRHYLNVYIPILKPDRSKTNLSIVPADRFRARAPEIWNKLEWRGASVAKIRDGATIISDDQHGGILGRLDFLLDEVAETPELAAGDALLLRGDLFHKTQDANTQRVAISIRAFNTSVRVTREHFETSCPAKDKFVRSDQHRYDRIVRALERKPSMRLVKLLKRLGEISKEEVKRLAEHSQ